jgi:hypothetical protein
MHARQNVDIMRYDVNYLSVAKANNIRKKGPTVPSILVKDMMYIH